MTKDYKMPKSRSDFNVYTHSDNKIEDDMDYIAERYLKPIKIHRKSEKDKRKQSKTDFQCKICKLHVSDKLTMLKHYRYHNNAKEQYFVSKQNQRNPESATNQTKLDRVKSYLCKICQKFFDDKDACLDHKLEVHADVPKYQKLFTTKFDTRYDTRYLYSVPVVKLDRLALNTIAATTTLPSKDFVNKDITHKSQTPFQKHLTDVNKSNHSIKLTAYSRDMLASTSRQNPKDYTPSLLDEILRNNEATDLNKDTQNKLLRSDQNIRLDDVIQKEPSFRNEEDLTKLYQCDSCKLHYVEFDYIKKHSRNCLGSDINNSLAAKCNICNISFFYKELKKHSIHHNMGIKEFDFITVLNSNRAKTNAYSDEVLNQVYVCKICGMNFCNKTYFLLHKSTKRHRTDIDKKCRICGRRFYTKCLPVHLESHINRYDNNVMSSSSSKSNKKSIRSCEKDNNVARLKAIPGSNECKQSNLDTINKCTYDTQTTQKAAYHKRNCVCIDYYSEIESEKHLAHHKFLFKKKAVSRDTDTDYTRVNDKLCQRMLEKYRSQSSQFVTKPLRESHNNDNIRRYKHRVNAVKNNESSRKYTTSNNDMRKFNKLKYKNIQKYLYKCSLCDLYFLTLNGLKMHVFRKVHDMKGLNCKHCGYTFSKLSLKWHENLHHRDLKLKRNNFIIRDCSMYIPEAEVKKTKDNLATKWNPHNTNEELNDEIVAEQLNIGNNILNKCVSNKEDNDNEIQMKTGCDDNDTTSNDNEGRNNEIEDINNDKTSFITNSSVKLYLCKDCNVHFITISTYIRHIKEHNPLASSEFKKCDYCGLNFVNANLNMHVNEHHSNTNNTTVLIESQIQNEGITEYKSHKMLPIYIDKCLGNNIHEVNTSGDSANKPNVIDTIYTIGVQKNKENNMVHSQSKRNTFLSRCTSCRCFVIAKSGTDNQNGHILCEKCKDVSRINDTLMFLDKSTLLYDNTLYGTVSNGRNDDTNVVPALNSVDNVISMPIRFRRRTTSNSINNKINTLHLNITSKDVGCNTENEIENSKKHLHSLKNTDTTHKIQLKEGECMREFVEIKIDENKTIKLQFLPYQNLPQVKSQSTTADMEEIPLFNEEIRQISSISNVLVENVFENVVETPDKQTPTNTIETENNNRNKNYTYILVPQNTVIDRSTKLNEKAKNITIDKNDSKTEQNACKDNTPITNNDRNTKNSVTIEENEKETSKMSNSNVSKQINYTIVLSDDEEDIKGIRDIKQRLKGKIITNINKSPNHNSSVIIIDDDDKVIVPKTELDVTVMTEQINEKERETVIPGQINEKQNEMVMIEQCNGKENETAMTEQINEREKETVITGKINEKPNEMVMIEQCNGKENEKAMTEQTNERETVIAGPINEKENKTLMIEQSNGKENEKVITRQSNEKSAIMPSQVIKVENSNIKKEITCPDLNNVIKIDKDLINSVTEDVNSVSSMLLDSGAIKSENIVSNVVVKIEKIT